MPNETNELPQWDKLWWDIKDKVTRKPSDISLLSKWGKQWWKHKKRRGTPDTRDKWDSL